MKLMAFLEKLLVYCEERKDNLMVKMLQPLILMQMNGQEGLFQKMTSSLQPSSEKVKVKSQGSFVTCQSLSHTLLEVV